MERGGSDNGNRDEVLDHGGGGYASRGVKLDGTDGLLRPMRRHEFDVLVDWAADEGWNPGRHDPACFWAADPDGFVAVEMEGQLAAGGSIVSYGRQYGFMGFFIVRRDLRGRGIGRRLWHARTRMLRDRLDAGAPIGMDGVFAMEPFYAKGGFVREHRELRFEAPALRPPASPAAQSPDAHVVQVGPALSDDALRYDSIHFPGPREAFMRCWLSQPGSISVAAMDQGSVVGLAVARQARTGVRVGPLFADSPPIAESLLSHILDACTGMPVHLDVPERNPDAMSLVERHGMRQVFGCAKMTLGTPPALPWDRIYGVTSLELG
ncbi:MAG: GNAT family N-acetyltransferase [Phycisphaerales bacterium]|nr:GNAT family N-acetyltransferase [Phycisphaerales bacterium]